MNSNLDDNSPLNSYKELFDLATMKYIDDNKRFALVNYYDKFIILDTTTYFINATKFIQIFSSGKKTNLNDWMKTASAKNVIEEYEQPYKIKQGKKSNNYSGTYIHPDIIIYLIIYCNIKLAANISKFITCLMLKANNNKSFLNEIEYYENETKEILEQRKEILDEYNKPDISDEKIRDLENKCNELEYDLNIYKNIFNSYDDSLNIPSTDFSSLNTLLIIKYNNEKLPESKYCIEIKLINDSLLKYYQQRYNKITTKISHYGIEDVIESEIYLKFPQLEIFNINELLDLISFILKPYHNKYIIKEDDFQTMINIINDYLSQYIVM